MSRPLFGFPPPPPPPGPAEPGAAAPRAGYEPRAPEAGYDNYDAYGHHYVAPPVQPQTFEPAGQLAYPPPPAPSAPDAYGPSHGHALGQAHGHAPAPGYDAYAPYDARNSADPYPAPPEPIYGYAQPHPHQAHAAPSPAPSPYGMASPAAPPANRSPYAPTVAFTAFPEPTPQPVRFQPPTQPHRMLVGFLVDLDRREMYWPHYEGTNVVGREKSRDHAIDLPVHQDTVSSQHAMVWVGEEMNMVRDLGSTNGTAVNGSPLGYGGESYLMDGDWLELGGCRLLFVDAWRRCRGR